MKNCICANGPCSRFTSRGGVATTADAFRTRIRAVAPTASRSRRPSESSDSGRSVARSRLSVSPRLRGSGLRLSAAAFRAVPNGSAAEHSAARAFAPASIDPEPFVRMVPSEPFQTAVHLSARVSVDTASAFATGFSGFAEARSSSCGASSGSASERIPVTHRLSFPAYARFIPELSVPTRAAAAAHCLLERPSPVASAPARSVPEPYGSSAGFACSPQTAPCAVELSAADYKALAALVAVRIGSGDFFSGGVDYLTTRFRAHLTATLIIDRPPAKASAPPEVRPVWYRLSACAPDDRVLREADFSFPAFSAALTELL